MTRTRAALVTSAALISQRELVAGLVLWGYGGAAVIVSAAAAAATHGR